MHTEGISDENVTGRPDDAVALTGNGAVPSGRSLNAVKAMAWMAGLMMIANTCVASGAMPLVALITPLKLPTAVGVPRIIPVVLLSVKPEGSAPLLTAKVGVGEPVAVTV